MARVAISLLFAVFVLFVVSELDPVLWLPFLVALAVVGVVSAAGAAAESWKAQLQARREEYERAAGEARLAAAVMTELRGVSSRLDDAVRRLGAALEQAAAAREQPTLDALALRYEEADLGVPAGTQAAPAVADPGSRRLRREPRPFRFRG